MGNAENDVARINMEPERHNQTVAPPWRRRSVDASPLAWLFVAFAAISMTQIGCVSRRMIVHSNPPGAMVLIEGKEVGYTPAGIDFTYYGTRELTLIKDGYETKTELVPVKAPWYEWPVIEFFSDNLLPGRITDRREIHFDLEPKRMVPNQDLLNRGRSLRDEAQIGQ